MVPYTPALKDACAARAKHECFLMLLAHYEEEEMLRVSVDRSGPSNTQPLSPFDRALRDRGDMDHCIDWLVQHWPIDECFRSAAPMFARLRCPARAYQLSCCLPIRRDDLCENQTYQQQILHCGLHEFGDPIDRIHAVTHCYLNELRIAVFPYRPSNSLRR